MSVSMTMNGAVLPVMAMFIVAAEEQVSHCHTTLHVYVQYMYVCMYMYTKYMYAVYLYASGHCTLTVNIM